MRFEGRSIIRSGLSGSGGGRVGKCRSCSQSENRGFSSPAPGGEIAQLGVDKEAPTELNLGKVADENFVLEHTEASRDVELDGVER